MSASASFAVGSKTLCLIQGDITRDDACAIVNAANSALAGGGGVDGAIHRAAGPQLLAACREIIAKIGRLPAGQAVITPGFKLPARYVIHTVGPIWAGGNQGEPETLRAAYANSLALAEANACDCVAFPAISTGVYGYPVSLAAPLALQTLAQGLTTAALAEVRLYVYSPDAFAAWHTAAVAQFGDA